MDVDRTGTMKVDLKRFGWFPSRDQIEMEGGSEAEEGDA